MNGTDFYDLYQEYWNKTHEGISWISKDKAEDYCRTLFDLLGEQLDKLAVDDRITFYGFGTFYKKKKAARVIGDIRNGGRVELPPKEVVTFAKSEKK